MRPAEHTATAGDGSSVDAYLPQLDGLRAIAVLLVLAQHWVTNPLNVPAPLGFVGVTLFFVLSGYLISRILIQAKHQQDAGRSSLVGSLKTFYARRFLRIFPIYYLTIFVLFALDWPNVRDAVWPLVTYTSNLYFLVGGSKLSIEHLWTLAIEEQYYLIYPLLVLTLGRVGRLRALLAMIAVAFASRFALNLAGVSVSDNKYFTLSCFDSFALGGLLAHAEDAVGASRMLSVFRQRMTGLLVAGFTVAMLAFGFVLGDRLSMRELWFRFVVSVASLYLVGVSRLEPKATLFNRILSLRALQYIGKISYGIYLYHLYAPYLVTAVFPAAQDRLVVRVVTFFSITVLVSALSWWLVEQPLNRLKKRFSY
ncbi:MAG: acyltransferase [Polyangiaceae bacterium]|nr:acyltransferase [Polyangiaceae bacterium]